MSPNQYAIASPQKKIALNRNAYMEMQQSQEINASNIMHVRPQSSPKIVRYNLSPRAQQQQQPAVVQRSQSQQRIINHFPPNIPLSTSF